MSQRVAGCCCGSPCDPTLGVCCTKVGGVCDCITDKTLCECTKLGGVWNANNLCPNGCLGSCCKFNMNNVLVDCTDNITECACAAMATARRTYTTFHRGLTCANNQCPTCSQTQTCQTNRIFNVAFLSEFRTESVNRSCACPPGNGGYINVSSSSETPRNIYDSNCSVLIGASPLPFVLWYDDSNIDTECFNYNGLSYSYTNTYNCDDGDGTTGTVMVSGDIKLTPLATIIVPPCGIWVKGGTFKKTMITISTGCGCPGVEQYDFLSKTTWCWPEVDTPLAGCNFNGRNFDLPNPYGNTDRCERYVTETTTTPNGCS